MCEVKEEKWKWKCEMLKNTRNLNLEIKSCF